jgi:rhodanese-related sulfurtransferase/rubrerythrin
MGFHEIQPDELRQFIKTHHENEYLLVDVRQPDEYEQGHIPGARLLPLPELAVSMDTLPMDKELVFYCRSGARSIAASTLVEEESEQTEVYNLTGGIISWEGNVVERPPQVRIFAASATPEQMMMTAMDLEKGAMRFYTMADERWGGENWSEVFARLAEAEIGHAMMIYQLLSRENTLKDDFDTVFSGLQGDVLEGGTTVADALDRAASAEDRYCVHLIELALNIEYSAFDLYRTMADQVTDSKARDAFLKISQAEKSHMNSLIGALGTCPS